MTEPLYDPDDPLWIDPVAAAGEAKVQVDTLRQWKARGLVRTNASGLYSLRDIWNWLQQRDTSKAQSLSDHYATIRSQKENASGPADNRPEASPTIGSRT